MQKGQTLIEVLVALGVAVVVMTAVSIAVLTGLNNAQYSKLQNQATQYAQQGMEIVQSYRDSRSLGAFTAGTTTRCMPSTCSPSSGYTNCFNTTACSTQSEWIDGTFRRTVTVSKNDALCGTGGGTPQQRVVVAVSWADGKCSGTALCHNVTVTSCMLDSFRVGL